MTLPSSPPLSLSQVATELGLSAPLSLGHAWIIALAGKSALPVSMSDLLGKTGRFDGSVLCNGPTGFDWTINLNDAPFFGGTLNRVDANINNTTPVWVFFDSAPNFSGNIIVKNNTTGASLVFAKQSSTQWQANTNPGNLLRRTFTDNFTILPSN